MEISNEIYENALQEWGIKNKGVGTIIINPPLDLKPMILMCITKIYSKFDEKIIILVNTYTDRVNLIEYFKSTNNENITDIITKKLKNGKLIVVTSNLLMKSPAIVNYSKYVICCNLVNYDETILDELKSKRFKLIVTTSSTFNKINKDEIIKLCPILNVFKESEVSEIRNNPPVKETLVGIDIPVGCDIQTKLTSYDEYIRASINIFGSFKVLQQVIQGNKFLNVSGSQICDTIARENGWSENLDMNYGYNVTIDEFYNPNALRERAAKTYEISRLRIKLVSSIEYKLNSIINIINNNPTDKILIINKDYEFADLVTKTLNLEGDICRSYHNNLENIDAVDDDGKPILVKSGVNKGKIKRWGNKSQKTYYEKLFNLDKIKVISTNASPDNSLTINVDTIIITSTLCDTIETYLYRLSGVYVRPKQLKLYTLYSINTIEEKRIMKRIIGKNHIIVNNIAKNVNNDNFSDFIVDD